MNEPVTMNGQSPLVTTFHFELPMGVIDARGELHREGVMRLATGQDELRIQKNPLVQSVSASRVLVMLSQVIVQLGRLPECNPDLLADLFLPDLKYLQQFFNAVNPEESALSIVGELLATPSICFTGR